MNILVFSSGGKSRIAVAAAHHTWEFCQISLLDGSGKLLRDYWHTGHIFALSAIDFMDQGRPLLYAAGIANGYNSAVLVVLDPEKFEGVSWEEHSQRQLPGPRADEVARVLFPRGSIALAQEAFSRAGPVERRGDKLMVTVYDEPGSDVAGVIHTLTSDLTYEGARLSSAYLGRYQALLGMGLLHAPLNPRAEEARLSQVRWITRPKMGR